MAYSGQIIHNPVSGERIEFLRTAADTDGELLEIELELAADGHVPGAHVHPEQEERFKVLEGTIKFRLGLSPPAACTSSSTPAMDRPGHGSRWFRLWTWRTCSPRPPSLAHEGKRTLLRSGVPGPLHLALFVQQFEREVRAPFPPAPVDAGATGAARCARAAAAARSVALAPSRVGAAWSTQHTSVTSRKLGAAETGHWGMRREDADPTRSRAMRGDEDEATRRQGRSTGVQFMTLDAHRM